MLKNHLKKIILSLFLVVQINSLYSQGFGQSTKITDWKFNLGDVKLGENELLDDSKWEDVQIPHDWSVKQFASPHLSSCTGFLPGGIGWYRTKIEIPTVTGNKRYYLYFKGVYNRSEVYINGSWLGKQYDGYISFMYDITPYIKPGKENVVAVRVDHSKDADSRWYTGSGIYRNVHLVEASSTHIDLWGVYYKTEVLDETKATVNIETKIRKHQKNSAPVKVVHQLFDANGSLITSVEKKLSATDFNSTTLNQILTVKNPNFWGIDSPYLYLLKTIVTENEVTVDENSVNVGIRTLKFDPNKGFALNNKWMKIKGVCLHHDAGVLGSAVPKAVWREKVLQLKEIGCNGIRMSHNPQSTDLYDVCDELGMLVMDEAFDEWEYPKKKWLVGWNVGEPGFQGAAEYFREHGKKTLESMIYRDRNHPSIIMWSIGNEVDYPNDPYTHPVLNSEGIGQYHVAGYQPNQPDAKRLGDIATELAGIVRNIDNSRPVTAALAGPVMSNETAYPGALDVVGYNYTESRYKMDHEKYPNRVLYGSENRHDLESWKAVRDNDYIFGQFLWTGADYLGEAGKWPSRGSTSGLIDMTNSIKPQGYFRQSLWSDKPMVYAGTFPKPRNSSFRQMFSGKLWNYEDGQIIRVTCFTNGDEIELLVNDKVKGERQKYNQETGANYWDIPFEPGVLKVVSYKNNVKVAEDVIVTSGSPAIIKCHTENDILKGKNNVALIQLTITDKEGNLVYLADNEIKCTISGPGRLLGLENASSNVAENFNDNVHRCNNGKLLAYIQATENSGDIVVEFESAYLESGTQKIKIGN
jgi:beta-galactosidase